MAIQQAKLTKAQEELHAAMSLLAEKEAEVRQCQSVYEEAMTKKQVLIFCFLCLVRENLDLKLGCRKYLMQQ